MTEANEKTSDDRLQEIAESRALVATVAAKLDTATIQLEGAKGKVKKLQADWDNAIAAMLDAIDNRQFELHGSADDEARAERERAWAEIPLASLEDPAIPPSALIKLEEAGITTMAGLMEAESLQSIPGIGRVAAEKI
ncbi:MAG TPA: hypothetical protein VMY69_08060, partial [Phycisphaerae bacterium]|nr:hypothetical protein [Phycisphaerae bacterium]